MCCLPEYVSVITNPFGLMRDCLFFFLFFFVYCHSCSCFCALFFCALFFFLFFFLSDVNLTCKKKRKNTSKLCWWSLTCLLRPGCDTVSSLPPCMFEPETKTIVTGARKKIQEHSNTFLCYVRLLSGKKETLRPPESTLWPPPNLPTFPFFHHPTFFSCCSLDLLDYVSCIIEDATVIVTHRPFLSHRHTHTHTQTLTHKH